MRSHIVSTITARITFLAMVLLSVTASSAEEGEPEQPLALSIEESVRIAIANNPLVQMASEEKNVARGKLTEAYSAALPMLTASGTYTWLERVPSATFEGRTFSLGEQGQYSTDLTLAQSLYRGGATAAGIRTAKHYRTLADETLREVKQAIVFSAEKAYYDVLLNAEFYTVSRDALQQSESHRSDVEKRHVQGFVSDYDLLRAQISVSNTNSEMIQARNALRLAQTAFLKTLAVPLTTEFELTDSLAYEPAKAEVGESFAAALAQRPEIRQADLKIVMQRETIKSTVASLYPSVSVVGTWEGGNASRFSFGGTDWDQGWYAGVMVSVPIFEGRRTKGRLVQETAKLRQYELEKRDLLLSIELEVKQSVLSLEDATEFVESQGENVKQAQEGLRLATVRYDQEMATQLDVLDARHALTVARKNYAQAVYSHRLAKLALRKAQGIIQVPEP